MIDKMKKIDRIFILKPKEGKVAEATSGLTDKRLFTGENKLHAIMDTQTTLWHLKYDQGILPPLFKQQFTGWLMLLKVVKEYYTKRNIDIVEIID